MKTIKRLSDSRIFRALITCVALLYVLQSGRKLLPECNFLPDFSSPWFAAAIVLALLYRIINAFGWTLVLRAMNQSVDGAQATRVWLHAESRRWLPGGVWGYASRATQAQQLNVSSSVASASMLIELLLTIAACIIVFFPVTIVYRNEVIEAIGSLERYSFSLWIGVGSVCTVAVACILLRRKLTRKINSFRERLQLLQDVSLDARKMFSALTFYVAMGWLNGMVTACLLWSMPLTEFPPLVVVVAATSLSWVIGFFAIFAPGGLFVREASFAVSTGLWMPYSIGLSLAILARVVQLGAEVGGMLWVWIMSRPQLAHSGNASLVLKEQL